MVPHCTDCSPTSHSASRCEQPIVVSYKGVGKPLYNDDSGKSRNLESDAQQREIRAMAGGYSGSPPVTYLIRADVLVQHSRMYVIEQECSIHSHMK
jgi:hypothetical protein